jgi:hypothetical protein
MDTDSALVVIIAVQALVIIILTWRSFGAIPPDIVDMLIDIAKAQTGKTPSKWDDEALEIMAGIYVHARQRNNEAAE